MIARAFSLLLALAVIVATGFAALVGMLWGFGLKCDDSCSTPPPWRDDPNSWQWDALGGSAVAAFALALLFGIGVAARRPVLASAALAAAGALAYVFLVLFRDSGLTSQPERGWLGLGVGAVGGAAAIVLSRRTRA